MVAELLIHVTLDICHRACKSKVVSQEIETQEPARNRLRDVVVRPVEQHDVPRWLELMRSHHYLGFGKSAGKRILYAATLDGEWVALLSWAAAALHVRCRDEWIGWDRLAKRHRLRQITNNTRFLMLPGLTLPNLASRVLALNIQRLRKDWSVHHGHEVVLAETFVDPTRFRGTCYIAQGWVAVGTTEGFGHHPRGAYQRHDNPKMMLVRPLVLDACERLRNPLFTDDEDGSSRLLLDVGKLPIDGDGGLMNAMRRIPSVRESNASYPQCRILALAVCAMLSGARSHHDIARYMKSLTPSELERLGLSPNRLPSRWTIWRLLNRLDATVFDRHVGEWLSCALRTDARRNVLDHAMGGARSPPLLGALRDA